MATNNALDNSSSPFNVDNLHFETNTISSTDTNGNVILDPDGTGDVQVASGSLQVDAGDVVILGGAASIDPGAATDSYLQFNESTTGKWRCGNDASDDSWRLSQGSALGTNDTFIMTTAGERTMPLQPAFFALDAVAATNATGDGTVFTIIYDNEVTDQNGDYDPTTGIFTAPVTGLYFFNTSIFVTNLTAAHGPCLVTFAHSGSYSVQPFDFNLSNYRNGAETKLSASYFLPMTAGQTMKITIQIAGSTKTVTVGGGGNNQFSGFLVC